MNETPFVQARWFYEGRQGVQIDLLVFHSTEGSELPTSAEALGDYFQHIERKASSHVGVDSTGVVWYVHLKDTAFGASKANNRGAHCEQCGKAGQTGAQWDDEASHATILHAAQWAAAVIRELPHIKPEWLLAPELKRRVAAGLPLNGCTSHAEWENAFPSTGHWDPGPNYPHDRLIAAVKAELGLGDDDMTPAESAQLAAVKAQADEVRTRVDALAGSVRTVEGNALARYNDLAARIDKVASGGGAVDYDRLATAVADKLAARLQS